MVTTRGGKRTSPGAKRTSPPRKVARTKKTSSPRKVAKTKKSTKESPRKVAILKPVGLTNDGCHTVYKKTKADGDVVYFYNKYTYANNDLRVSRKQKQYNIKRKQIERKDFKSF